jgi:hypothetical protein
MKVSFGVRDGIAAGDEEFGALAGLEEEGEDLGADQICERGTGGGEDVFEIIENEQDGNVVENGLKPVEADVVGRGLAEFLGEFGEIFVGAVPKCSGEGAGDVGEAPTSGRGDEPAAVCHALHDASGDGAFADATGAEDLAAGFATEFGDGFGIVREDADDGAGFAAAADEFVFFEEWDGSGGSETGRCDDGHLLCGAVENGLLLPTV